MGFVAKIKHDNIFLHSPFFYDFTLITIWMTIHLIFSFRTTNMRLHVVNHVSFSLTSSFSTLPVCVIQANKPEKCPRTISITVYNKKSFFFFHSDRVLNFWSQIWGTFYTKVFSWPLETHCDILVLFCIASLQGICQKWQCFWLFSTGHCDSSQAPTLCNCVILCFL